MKVQHILLKYYARAPHLSMVIAGFEMLHRKGIIEQLEVTDATNENIPSTNTWIAEAIIDSSIRVAYDVCDGYVNQNEINEKYASSVDYYFIRSFSDEINQKLFSHTNIYPLGLNYYCTVKGNPFDKSANVKESAKKIAKKILSNFNPQIGVVFDVKKYEKAPSYDIKKEPKILFNTRLWNPQGEVGETKWERKHPERIRINETRIGIIQQTREKYGANFAGGLYDTQYARENAPADIILSNSKTTKKQYLNNMQSFDICIGSEGLHGSIGWKTAEYVASSKAIIMERPKYIVPGDFAEGKNYLGFSSVEECMQKLDYLCTHREKIAELQKNNQDYYNKWLRPDMQILHTLEIALIKDIRQ